MGVAMLRSSVVARGWILAEVIGRGGLEVMMSSMCISGPGEYGQSHAFVS